MVATQVLPTIQEIWEMMNDHFLRTLPPSEETVRAIEDSINEAFNDNDDNETIYWYALQDTDIDEVCADWLDEYRFATQFVNQYTEEELKTHYDDLASNCEGLAFRYEGSTPAQKLYCILWNYVRANQHVIRLR